MSAPTADHPLLECRNVSVKYGGVSAVAGVDLQCDQKRLYGLVGPNGSGKTTLLNAITRFTPLSSGGLLFDGEEYTSFAPNRLAALGIARSFQAIRLLAGLNVEENVALGADARLGRHAGLKWWLGLRSRAREQAAKEAALLALEQVGLLQYAKRDPTTLSYGTQRRVEIARAITMEPRLLLLDEPTAGMNEAERNEVIDVVEGLTREGMTILLVEHNLRLINQICSEIFVMDAGRCIASGDPASVMDNKDVRAAYLGASEP
jgi:branched-chain amino acid transport system ATP-binding protein